MKITKPAVFFAAMLCAGAALAQTPPGFDPVYYSNRYHDLKKAFGSDAGALAKHWTTHGKQELRFPSVAGDATKQPYAKWKEGCEKGWWGFETQTRRKGGRVDVQHHCAEDDYKYAAWASSAVFYEPKSAHLGDHMRVGDWLLQGQHLQSANKSWAAALQSDGNFCIYQNHPPGSNPLKIHGTAHWCTMPRNAGQGPFYAQMQGDGNFCVYKGTPERRTGGVNCVLQQSAGDGLFFAVLQDDRNFAIYRGTGPKDNKGYVWDRITQAPPKPDNFGQKFLKAGASAVNTMNKTMEDYQKAKEAAGPVPGVR